VEYHLSKDLSVKEYLAILSKFTSKTNIYEKYKDYTDCKNKTFNHIYIHYCSELSYNRNNEKEMKVKKARTDDYNNKSKKFYQENANRVPLKKKSKKNDDPNKEKYIVGGRITGTINYRKLKWNSHINERKSEDNMVNNVTNKFGKGSLYAFGDYGQYNMKYQDPTKGKGFRNLFVRRKLNIALVDEYNTSCKCSTCGSKLEKFHKRISGRPERIRYLWNQDTKQEIVIKAKKIKEELVHGLLRCTNTCKFDNKSGQICSRIWNRDTNAARNIKTKAFHVLNSQEISDSLKRVKPKLVGLN